MSTLSKSITFVFLLTLSVSVAIAQSVTAKNPGVLVDGARPPVYIDFIRTGTCKKDFSNFNFGNLCDSKNADTRSFRVAWLRVVNNTKWSIGLTVDKSATEENATVIAIPSTEFVDVDGDKAGFGKMLAKNAAEMDVVYKSEVQTGCDFHMKTPKGQSCYMIKTVAPKIPLPAMSSDVFVAPGESVLFPLDLSHVSKYVNVYVLYNFSWEYSGKNYRHFAHYDSQHRAYFSWSELQKEIAKEKEAKKPLAKVQP